MSVEPRRPAVTVAVLGGDKRRFRDLLQRLAPALQRGDDVVMLGPRADGRALGAWRHHDGSARLIRPVAPPELHQLVLVLDDRVQPREGLLDALTGLAADPLVAAVGARSNVADGPELLVGVPYRPGDVAKRRAFLRPRPSAAPHTLVTTLGGPAVLLRRELLEAAGGLTALAQGTGLPRAVAAARAAGKRLVVAEEAYVHHPGGRSYQDRGDWPFVSACLIVKDEEAQLANCLASARALADEVVVYDTGSTDHSVELARELGAQVVEGYWDGDFGRARNDALEACSGQWILWLDADETLTCNDPAALRDRLAATPSDLEAYLLLIDNLQGTEASTTLSHPAARLFRRAACRWEGRLHEQVVRRFDGRPPNLELLQDARIFHRGYLQTALQGRTKGERNLRTAFDDLAGGSDLDLATRVVSLARSYLLSGRLEEGTDLAQRALDLDPHPTIRRLALRTLAECALATANFDEALSIAERYRSVARVRAFADLVEGRAQLGNGHPEAALAVFDRLQAAVVDDDGFELRPSLVAVDRARALIARDLHDDAAAVLLETLTAEGGLDAHLGLLVECLERVGGDLGAIFRSLPPDRLAAFFPPLLQLQPEVADRVLEAWHGIAPTLAPLLATAAQLAARLHIDRQLVWSARLRQAGLGHACPLLANAAHAGTAPDDGLVGAAVAWASFRDERALSVIGRAALALPATLRPALAEAMAAIAPDLVPRLQLLWDSTAAAAAPADGTPASTGDAMAGAPTTLVVARRAAAAEALVLARARRAAGASVVLVQPDPDAMIVATLAAEGVTVRGWHEERPGTWREEALRALTFCSAEQHLDEVILCAGTEALAEAIRQLLPDAEVHAASSVVLKPEPSGGPPLPAPVGVRSGVCVAVPVRALPEPSFDALRTLLAELVSQRPGVGLLHVGDDPDGRLRAAVPSVLVTGPVVDLESHLATAKVLLTLADDPDGELACRAAHRRGTAVVRLAPCASTDASSALAGLLAALDATTLPSSELDAPGTHRPRADRSSPLPAYTGHRQAPVRTAGRTETSSATARSPLVVRVPHGTSSWEGDGATAALASVLVEAGAVLAPGEVAPDAPDSEPVPLEVWLGLPATPRALLASGAHAHQRVVILPSHLVAGPPAAFVGVLRDHVRESWVATPGARDAAIGRGLPTAGVHVVPPAVDLATFRPDGDVAALAGADRPRILCIGPATLDSGIDALLEVWLSEPNRPAGSTLVVQLLPALAGQPAAPWLDTALRRVADDPRHGLVLLEPPGDDAALAAVLRAGDLLVHPRRAGDGSRLVMAAQACGLPVLATDVAAHGLVDETTGWTISTVPRAIPTAAADGWTGAAWAEPGRAALAEGLRAALADPLARERRSTAALARTRRALEAAPTRGAVQARLEHLLPAGWSRRAPAQDELLRREPA